MILTIKRPHGLDLNSEENKELYNFMREGNNVKRCALNYFKKHPEAKVSNCEQYIKTLNNIKRVNASWIKSIVNSIKNIDKVEANLFGSRFLLEKLAKKDYKNEVEKGSIKAKYIFGRNTQMLMMRGSKSDPNTNRCGKVEIKNDVLYLDFYINKNNKYHFIIKNLERQQLKDLSILYELILKKEAYFNIAINKSDIFIQYDNSCLIDKRTDLIANRVLSMDLNPHEIGLVIMDGSKLIEEKVYKIKDLIENHDANKTDNELQFLSKTIVNLALHYKCSVIVLENLKMSNSNVKIINEWNIRDTMVNIEKWCDYYGIKYKEVPPYYTSFMGIINSPTKLDCIGAAIEIGLRYQMTKDMVRKHIEVFLSSSMLINCLPNRWKNEVDRYKRHIDKESISMNELYNLVKSNKSLYYRVRIRFSEYEKIFTEFSLKSKKSLMSLFDVKRHQIA
jgi:IS605 OrfB family transposase